MRSIVGIGLSTPGAAQRLQFLLNHLRKTVSGWRLIFLEISEKMAGVLPRVRKQFIGEEVRQDQLQRGDARLKTFGHSGFPCVTSIRRGTRPAAGVNVGGGASAIGMPKWVNHNPSQTSALALSRQLAQLRLRSATDHTRRATTPRRAREHQNTRQGAAA